MGSSILGSAKEGNQPTEAMEEEVEIDVDTFREWIDAAPPPTIIVYDWAPHQVGLYAPFYITSASLEYLISRVSILASSRDAESIMSAVCRTNERACHRREGHENDFFYVYTTLFRDLGVRLPFTEFQSGVQRALYVAPTQLHPNGWANMQVFFVVCIALALTPTPSSFLYFFPCHTTSK